MIKRIKFISIPVARPKTGARLLYGQTRVYHHHGPAVRRKTALDRVTRPESRNASVLFTAEGEEKRIGGMMNMSFECDDIDKTYTE